MPKALTTSAEQWNAFRSIISAIREELHDLVRSVGDRAITGDGESVLITPRVTKMYRDYAAGIQEVILVSRKKNE